MFKLTVSINDFARAFDTLSLNHKPGDVVRALYESQDPNFQFRLIQLAASLANYRDIRSRENDNGK